MYFICYQSSNAKVTKARIAAAKTKQANSLIVFKTTLFNGFQLPLKMAAFV